MRTTDPLNPCLMYVSVQDTTPVIDGATVGLMVRGVCPFTFTVIPTYKNKYISVDFPSNYMGYLI